MNIGEGKLTNANKVMENHVVTTDNICKIVNPVYAMGRTIEERMGIKRGVKKRTKKGEKNENRRLRKWKKLVAWLLNEIYRRKVKRKATKKKKEILEKLKNTTQKS